MGTALWDYPQEYLVVIRAEKVSSFVKFDIILLAPSLPPPPSFVFIRPLQMQGMEFYDKFIDRFLDISKIKNPAKQMSSNNLEPSKANALG